MDETLGGKIKYYRKQKGYSQEKLAQEAEISKMSIRRYESGERQPGVETLKKIATALDVNLLNIVDVTQLGMKISWPEIQTMMSKLDREDLEELIKQLEYQIENPPKPDKDTLIKIYDNMTDHARKKLIAYAEDLWCNPVTHKLKK